MKTSNLKPLLVILCAALLLPISASAAKEKNGNKSKPDKITDAIKDGKLILDARLRYELSEILGADESAALTARMRLGYETGKIYGFYGLAEFEGTHALNGEEHYSPYGTGTRTIIADPENAELNRLLIGWNMYDTHLRVGRQRIILDNARFIGNVGWRQNEQTYDAVSISNNSLDDFTVTYAWIDQVNRIFGRSAPTGALRNLHSKSHVVNAKYSGCKYAKPTLYDYYLEFDNSAANSSNTFGGSLGGSHQFDNDRFTFSYYGELAKQEDVGSNPNNYDAIYYHASLQMAYKKLLTGKVGYEVLGSDKGFGFRTPAATGHAFNGYADAFLTTPAAGLRDLYLSGKISLRQGLTLAAIYHNYEADATSADFGQEVDLVIGYKYNDHWSATIKWADYFAGDSATSPASRQRLSSQIDYKF